MSKKLLSSLILAITSFTCVAQASTYTESTVPVDFTDLSGTGNPLSLGDDNVSGPIPIGFDFDFHGVRYSTLYVSSNGFVSFLEGQGSACCSGHPIPESGSINAFIAAVWTDLYPGAGGEVSYQTLGSPGTRTFVLMFKNVPHFSGGIAATFNIKLFEGTNRIETHIVSSSSGGRTVTIGIENQDGTEGIQSYHGSQPPSNVAYAYSLFAPCLTVLGNNVEIPSGSADADPANHTDLGVLSTSSLGVKRTYVLRNHGNDTLHLAGYEPVTIEGSPAFVVTRQPVSPIEENGGESVVEIAFHPGSPGVHRATVKIASNDPVNDPYTFVLSARSADPVISVTRVDRFETTLLGKSSRPRRIHVTNTGEVPVVGLRAHLLGKGAGDYLISAFTSRTIQPGETAHLLVTFQPRSAGMRKAILEIRSDAPVNRVALSGRAEMVERAANSPRFPHH